MALRRSVTALLLTACATSTGPTPTAEQVLGEAEGQVQNAAFDEALTTLDGITEDLCPKRLRDRRDLARARAEFGRGDPWAAYSALEDFSDLYPHSELRGAVVELLWDIAEALQRRDSSFLIFWSDRRAARTVLEHLITRHPDTQRLADALVILGDMAMADGDYDLAQQRYRDILLNRPESDWRFYAQFRFAMSLVAGLRGSAYDLDQMEHAANELRSFLANAPENPQMVAESERALALLADWQVERHLRIADFYRTVGSSNGERRHLELATQRGFETAESFPQARERLQSLLAALPNTLPAAPEGSAR